jgi:hypothetical protein
MNDDGVDEIEIKRIELTSPFVKKGRFGINNGQGRQTQMVTDTGDILT